MQIKTRVRYPFSPARTATTRVYKQGTLQGARRKRSPLLVRMTTGAAAMESVMEVPYKTQLELPCDPANPFLGQNSLEKKRVS